MKLSCGTQELLGAVQLVSRAISNQQALPILGNILIKAEGKQCTVSATDLEISIITHFEANIENEGSITIPAKALLNFAQYNTDSEVKLETVEGTQLRCTSAHAKTVLSGELASDYPAIGSVEKRTSFAIDSADLLEALHLVTFASAKSSLRPVLSGVYFRTEGKNFILVATDSYRLSEYRMPTGATEEVSCIIPVKVLDELRSILSAIKPPKKSPTEENVSPESQVRITLGDQQIEIQLGPVQLLSRLIEGKFPDYQQIVPKEHSTRAVVPTSECTTIVKRMHYFAKEVNNNLTFTIGNSKIHVATPQTQYGQDEAEITAETEGGEGKIALSSSYLLDFLAHISAESIDVRTQDSMHPAVFRLPGNERFLHLIMPLRMQ